MIARKPIVRRLVPVVFVLTLAGILAAPNAFAKIVRNTVDPVATIADHGRRILLTGPIQCDRMQAVDLRVTVTQRTTGALAEGKVRFLGTTDLQQWLVDAEVKGSNVFEPGPAIAVALATTRVGARDDDAHQWLVDVILVAE